MTWGSGPGPDPKDYTWVIFLITAIAFFLIIITHAHAFPSELGGNDVPQWQQEDVDQPVLLRKRHVPIPVTRPAQIGQIIFRVALKHHLNPYMMLAFASIESDFFPESNQHARTQYKGVYQIGKDEWTQWGCGEWCSIYDAEDNIEAAGAMLARHADWFKYWYGRWPTAGELYMIHQQGRGFFTHHTLTNIAGNHYPGMKGSQTWESFGNGWTKEVDRRIVVFTRLAELITGEIP